MNNGRVISVDEALRDFHQPEPLPPKAGDERYSTQQVSDATGVSLRMLQWWDEQKIIGVEVRKHRRQYTFAHALKCRIILCLGVKHVTLRRAGRAVRELDELGADFWYLARTDESNHVLLVDIDGFSSLVTSEDVLTALLAAPEPLVAVALSDEAKRLAAKLEAR